MVSQVLNPRWLPRYCLKEQKFLAVTDRKRCDGKCFILERKNAPNGSSFITVKYCEYNIPRDPEVMRNG